MSANKMEIKWKTNKGKCFEDLVSVLLKYMFPNIIFKQTNYVHDGGKDFYSEWNGTEEKIWVEAKNYNNHLELSKFSNTFIMADISEINRIIIFSMSEVTKGAKINIARYAAYHNKAISVYAGYDIWVLLNKYKNNFSLEEYIENIEELLQQIESNDKDELSKKISVTYEYYHAKQFNLAYRHDKDNYIQKNQLNSIPLHSLIAQEIHITNHDLFQQHTITIDCSEYKSSFLESYFYKVEPKTITILPASTTTIVVFFKIVDAYGEIILPTINFEESEVKIESSTYKAECCWLGEVPYIGESWTKLQNTVQLLENDISKKIVIIKGKSGVGKTRFLKEFSGVYFQKGYRIISLDFRSLKNLSLKNVLHNILSNIYILDESDNEKVICVDGFGDVYEDFHAILFDENYDCNAHIDRICNILISLLKRQHIFLLIDNVQDISSEAALFFEHLIFDLNNYGDTQSNILLSFNIDFLLHEKASTKLLAYAEQLSGVCLVELENFKEDDAKLYLLECLDPRRIHLDIHNYIDEILQRFGTNPFILKQLILYLKQCGIINFVDSLVCITNYENMKIVLSELPKGINNILDYRYSYLLNNIHLDNERSINRIIWSILFFGELTPNLIAYIKLDRKGIQALINYGFIEYNDKSEIVFCHQLIEKYFCIFFLGNQYIKNPVLTFIDDDEFLKLLFNITDRVGKINLCVENMLLRTRLNLMNSENFNMALKKLTSISPRTIMLPLVINSIKDCLNAGIKVDPSLEFKSLYALSLACQDRFDVHMAAEYTKEIVVYEQATYSSKTIAKEDMLQFFKNYVFQVSTKEKYIFLDWLMKESQNFCLSPDELYKFLGWIHNRYSKNLCSEHRFEEAEYHVQEALNIALAKNDYCSAAEAEIEYGNIYAYNNIEKTSQHWNQCCKNILKSHNNSVYFQVYEHGYFILSRLLEHAATEDLFERVVLLQELREKTFLYQKLFIDDVCADYYIIRYLENNYRTDFLENIIPQLMKMKSESYMHNSNFTILATYKLFTVYRLLYEKEKTIVNADMVTTYAYELIKNGIFEDSKLAYSNMILYEIFYFCQEHKEVAEMIFKELPENAKIAFSAMKIDSCQKQFQYAVTPLSDKNRQVNILHFNYIF